MVLDWWRLLTWGHICSIFPGEEPKSRRRVKVRRKGCRVKRMFLDKTDWQEREKVERVGFNSPIPLPVSNSVSKEKTQQLEKWWYPWTWVSAGILQPIPQGYQRMTTLHVINAWELFSFLVYYQHNSSDDDNKFISKDEFTSKNPLNLQANIHLRITHHCLLPSSLWSLAVKDAAASQQRFQDDNIALFLTTGYHECVWLINRDTMLISCFSPNTPEEVRIQSQGPNDKQHHNLTA